ncbi:MAG: YeeE/YedE family protein, partial [Chlorobi bacterium]|nr:YeeE/YedE family protein [Chlorobiota bacterium]
MGPLVPFDILGTDFNFIAAALIGFLFGYVLEQAGFSNSRKLAGVFYGYDFVVLRVFMTAGITAAAGLVFMDHLDMINLDYLYINPNFLWAGIVGGLIMGLGFIIGGYCPGTSLTGAAIGKIDAMFFVGGAALGILLFGETFPLFKD